MLPMSRIGSFEIFNLRIPLPEIFGAVKAGFLDKLAVCGQPPFDLIRQVYTCAMLLDMNI